MSRAKPKTGDPRLKLVTYVAWYVVLWIDNYLLLGMLFFVQLLLFLLLGGFRTAYVRLLWILVLMGVVLSLIAVFIVEQPVLEIVAIWFRWGVVVLATLNLAIEASMREMFFALKYFRVPWSVIFTLGIALRFLPISIDETRRCILSFRARGVDFGSGYRLIWQGPKVMMRLSIPLLVNILERGQRVWFSIELRGISHKLFRPALGTYTKLGNAIALLLAIVPLVVFFTSYLVE